jgi:hypothetical protein
MVDKGGQINPINTVAGLSAECNPSVTNCGHYCGNMSAGGSCNPSWRITGRLASDYPIFLTVTSNEYTSLSTRTQSTVTLFVNEIPAGTLSATLDAPSTLTAGSAANVKATVYCYGASDGYCGNITSYLFYNGIKMSSSGNLFTASQNPSSSCRDLFYGGTCDITWNVSATKNDTYTLKVIADSDYHTSTYGDVYNATSYQTQLIVNSKPVGVLSIENLYIIPESQTIILGGTARLGGNIKCSSSAPDNLNVVPSCGTVSAYPTSNGSKLQEWNCGNMNSSSNTCPVYWDITGKSLGSYALAINANSSLSDVRSVTSGSMILEVTENLGSLSTPRMEIIPDKINLTSPASTAILSLVVNCSANNCGKVNVALWLDGQMLDSGTRISTSQNLQVCDMFPCYRNWTLYGNYEGSFEIEAIAKSNKSIQEASGKKPLVVTDPKKPMLSLSTNLGSISASAGQAVQINASVTCLVKDCGQTALTLAYNAGAWKNLPYGNVASQGQNPVYTSMLAGQSYTAAWDVNFTQAGIYELKINATGSAANITNDEKRANITVSNIRGIIQILSPKPNQKFMRGDSVFLKANITGDGKPVTGLSPLVQELNAMLYDDGKHNDNSPDDGIYAGDSRIPADADGRYGLEFIGGGVSNMTYIYVNPTLYVGVNTEKNSYSWGEAIGISGDVRREDKGDKVSANVTIVLIHGKDSSWKYEVALNATAGYFSYNYSNLDTPNINGTLRILASARDGYANSGQGSANVSLKAAEGVHKIVFLMNKSNYRRGENMTISVKLAVGAKTGGIRKVNCTLSGSVTKALAERDGTYYGNYTIPTDIELGKKTLSCSFTGEESGTGYTDITIEPMILNISVISPYDPTYNVVPVVSTEPVELKVAVFYPDNSPVTDGAVEITVGSKKINMTRTGVPGIYSVSGVIFSKERLGAAMSTMVLTAQDPHNNTGKNEVDVVVDSGQFNWLWLLLVLLGLAVFFAGWLIYRHSHEEPPKIQIQEKIIRLPGERVREVQRVREIVYRPVAMPQKRIDPVTRLRAELGRLEERQKTIMNAKDLAEQQYYKRQIDEATFNKLMQRYEEKLIEIDAAIRQKRKELSGMEPG